MDHFYDPGKGFSIYYGWSWALLRYVTFGRHLNSDIGVRPSPANPNVALKKNTFRSCVLSPDDKCNINSDFSVTDLYQGELAKRKKAHS
jgi:hypothetical protein